MYKKCDKSCGASCDKSYELHVTREESSFVLLHFMLFLHSSGRSEKLDARVLYRKSVGLSAGSRKFGCTDGNTFVELRSIAQYQR